MLCAYRFHGGSIIPPSHSSFLRLATREPIHHHGVLGLRASLKVAETLKPAVASHPLWETLAVWHVHVPVTPWDSFQCTEPSGPWAWPWGWSSKALLSITFKWIWLKVRTDANWFSKHWVLNKHSGLAHGQHLPWNVLLGGRVGVVPPYLAGQGSRLQDLRSRGGRRLVTHRFSSAGSLVCLFRQLTTASWTPAHESHCQARVGVSGIMKCGQAAGGRPLWWLDSGCMSEIAAWTPELPILSGVAQSGRKYSWAMASVNMLLEEAYICHERTCTRTHEML